MFVLKKQLIASVFVLLLSAPLFACACGCGLFDVGTGSMLPVGTGTRVFVDYTQIDQNKNWSGTNEAPIDSDMEMSEIATYSTNFGIQHIFNRSWGIQVDAPYFSRTLTMTDATNTLSGLGDVKVKGFYTGLSEDMSTGLTAGIKLPTGVHDNPVTDRDTQLGTGSTDLLLGAYTLKHLTEDESWTSFYTVQLNLPLLISGEYRPGTEINGSLGLYYKGLTYGELKLTPLVQVIGTAKSSDSGSESDPDNSGYSRFVLSGGLEANIGKWRAYSDMGFPVYQNVNGSQLVASNYLKVTIGYQF